MNTPKQIESSVRCCSASPVAKRRVEARKRKTPVAFIGDRGFFVNSGVFGNAVGEWTTKDGRTDLQIGQEDSTGCRKSRGTNPSPLGAAYAAIAVGTRDSLARETDPARPVTSLDRQPRQRGPLSTWLGNAKESTPYRIHQME